MGNVLFSGLEEMSTSGLTGLERLNDFLKNMNNVQFPYSLSDNEKDY